jgi:hypothetical protein
MKEKFTLLIICFVLFFKSYSQTPIKGDLEVTGNITTSNYIKLGHSIRKANRAELHLHAIGENSISEIFFGSNSRSDSNVRWTLSDRGISEGKFILYEGPALKGYFAPRITVLRGGNVGIGIENPTSKFTIYGTKAEGWNSGIELNREGGGKGWIAVDGDGMKFRTPVDGDGFYFRDNDNHTSFFIKDGGNAFLNGKFEAKEIKVQQAPTADFVFSDNYKLKKIKEVESFIKENKHLPDFPSGKEIEEHGVNLGEMDAKLLQKIEELTLYMIQMNKEIENLKEENRLLKEQKSL